MSENDNIPQTEKDPELIEGGEDREIRIGSSWEEFYELMTMYFPDEAERATQCQYILEAVIKEGSLDDITVTVTPSRESGLDLSDERIARELLNETGE